MNLCNAEISQGKNGLTSIKINGREMGQYITGYSLTQEGHQAPILRMSVVLEGYSLSTKCIAELPEPYRGLKASSPAQKGAQYAKAEI